MKIIKSPHVLADSEERLFPESRHRSARIRKKLIARFGGEFKRVPAIYVAGDVIYAHPVRYEELCRRLASEVENSVDRMAYRSILGFSL